VTGTQATSGASGDYGETGVAGFHYRFDGALVHREQSPFQLIEIFENPAFGRVLILDGLVQTTERDEFFYHEMLVHIPLLIHPEPRSVLVIGGGDGGTLREVLRHSCVERAVMIEIDQRVTDVCREFMPSLGAEAWSDPRADVRFDDGIAFIRDTDERFDAIVIDSSDPVGPGEGLFTGEFYAMAEQRLNEGGVLAAQAGGVHFHQAELQRAYAAMKSAFPEVCLYVGNVPTYPGTGWSYLLSRADDIPAAPEVEDRLEARGISGLRYVSPPLVEGCFALPTFVKDVLGSDEPPHLFGPTPEEARRLEGQS
jgi:spermidine synthase